MNWLPESRVADLLAKAEAAPNRATEAMAGERVSRGPRVSGGSVEPGDDDPDEGERSDLEDHPVEDQDGKVGAVLHPSPDVNGIDRPNKNAMIARGIFAVTSPAPART